MTCVVGVSKGNRTWLGGDSQDTRGDMQTTRTDSKTFKRGPYILGFSGSFRGGQLLRHVFEPPTPPESGDLLQFMVTHFVPGLRSCFDVGGFVNDEEMDCLAATRGQLFYVGSDYQISQADEMVIGSGTPYAMGSLYATKTKAPRTRVLTALEAAVEYDTGCCGPFNVVNT